MRILFLLAGTALAAGVAQAQLYKWVDEDGRTQYTQTPPPPGRSAQEVKIQGAPPGKPATGATAAPSAPGKDKAKAGTPAAGTGPEAQRLVGMWRTGAGDRVQAEIEVQADSGSTVRLSQHWTAGSNSVVGTGSKYLVAGAKGSGTLTSQEAQNNPKLALPASMSYQFKDQVLWLTITSGPFAGLHGLAQ